jgi:uncharacterized protein
VRLLVDVNVIVSALFNSESTSGLLMRHWRQRQSEWLTCEQQMAELVEVLSRPHVASRVVGTMGSVYQFAHEFHKRSTLLPLEPPFEAHCRDPDDDYLVAMLLRHKPDFLVTGDKDLLALKPQFPRILTPRELIAKL